MFAYLYVQYINKETNVEELNNNGRLYLFERLETENRIRCSLRKISLPPVGKEIIQNGTSINNNHEGIVNSNTRWPQNPLLWIVFPKRRKEISIVMQNGMRNCRSIMRNKRFFGFGPQGQVSYHRYRYGTKKNKKTNGN